MMETMVHVYAVSAFSALNYMNEIRAEMEAEYYAEMMSNVDYY